MLRRISTKLVLAVLAAVVLPFLGFLFFTNTRITERMREVVAQNLKGLTHDLARQIDAMVEQRVQDIEILSGDRFLPWSQDSLTSIRRLPDRPNAPQVPWGAEEILDDSEGRYPNDTNFLRLARNSFDRFVDKKEVYDLILFLGSDGRLIVCNSISPTKGKFEPQVLRAIFERDFSAEPWFQRAMTGSTALQDQHASLLLPAPPDGDPVASHHFGIATPVYHDVDKRRVVGVLYALVNWKHVQALISPAVVVEYFRGYVGQDEYPSAYAWIWSSDCDTIIAHKDTSLYGRRVSDPQIGLPQLVLAARSGDWELYPEYDFRGERKIAAFKHCSSEPGRGLGWVVGVGIDHSDIFAQADELRGVLFRGTALVLLVVLWVVLYIARRTTQPIQVLQQHTQRVAAGDLDARVDIRSSDELGELAAAMNSMTADLKRQREQLVKAEKDAAWREMARQIAHDIKNPLTPIQLSLDLLARARAEGSPRAAQILESTLDVMRRQVTNLREIATDFYEFTGGRKPLHTRVELDAILQEVLALHAAMAEERGVSVRRDGPPICALADAGKLRRVLGNLVSNALQAMRGTGGELHLSTFDPSPAPAGVLPSSSGFVRIEIEDSGVGLSEEVRRHLFEPYFTTRSEGTGLGLAIARRTLEEMGGAIELVPRPPERGSGTIARVWLPRLPQAGEGAA